LRQPTLRLWIVTVTITALAIVAVFPSAKIAASDPLPVMGDPAADASSGVSVAPFGVSSSSIDAAASQPCVPPPPDPTPTPEPTDTPAPTDSPTPTPTPTASPTNSASPTPTPTPTPTATPTPEPTPTPTWGPAPGSRLGSPEIFGYLPYWDLNAQIDYGAITTVAYFGLGAGADGKLVRRTGNGNMTTEYSRWQSAKVDNAIAAAHANGDKFVLTVERMAWDDGGKANTRKLLSSTEARTSLVADIVSEIQLRNLDGVSLDFEPILSDQRQNFADFVGELRAGLYAANPAYQLTFAATGSQPGLTYQMFGDITASGAADAVIIMGYPLRAIDAKYAGGLAPMYSPTSYDLIQITNAYLNRVAPDKIVMALPWYGRQWPTVTAEVNSLTQTDRDLYDRAHNIGYTGALALAAQYGRQVDPVEQSAYSVFRWRMEPSCPETWKQVYYDDVETLGYKYDWVAAQGLAGIGIFALGYDDAQPELWKLLRVKYRGLVDTVPPTGSVSGVPGAVICSAGDAQMAVNATDGSGGSGAVYVRLSNVSDVGPDGTLVMGRTYPATDKIDWPLDDPAVGGSAALGARKVYAQWRDVAGNWSAPISTTVNLDQPTTATVSVANGAAAVSSPTVSVTVSQAGGRSITRVLLSNSPDTTDGVLTDSVDATLGTANSFSLVDPAAGGQDVDGPHTVYAQWQDSAGCWSSPKPTQLTLDRQAPTGTLSIVGQPAFSLTGSVSLLAPATDNLAGALTVQLSNDGQTWQSFPATADPIAWTSGAAPDGQWTISARWRDAAGNTSPAATVTLVLDRIGPLGTLKVAGGAAMTAADSVSVDAQATSAASTVTAVRLSNSAAISGGVLSSGQEFTPGSAITWPLAGNGAPAQVADGTHTVYAQWKDALGRWSAVVSAAITVDRSPPTVSAPTAGLVGGTQLGDAGVSIRLDWTATDAGVGVGQTSLESASNGGAWSMVAQLQGAAATDLQIDRSSSWQFRATATDLLGNVSTPAYGASFNAQVTEDGSSAVKYKGTWRKSTSSGASGSTTRYATARGATATLTFTGRSVAWVAPHGGKLGKAKVFIDGMLVTKVDLKGTSAQRQLVFTRTWASSGKHTIVIKVLHTRNRPRVDVDAFVVLT
jgi:spore germination protein YaaH